LTILLDFQGDGVSDHKKAILEYWAHLEFFTPYLLETVLDSTIKYQKLYADQPPKEPLPWAETPVIPENDPRSPFVKGYHLYLGLFSIEETADRARHVFAANSQPWNSTDWKRCIESSSITAFAKMAVTTHGIPLFRTLSLSTLPWAHGHLLEGAASSLTLEEYWKDVNRLLETLKEEFLESLPVKLVKEPGLIKPFFDEESLCRLSHLLYEWANFSPMGYPAVLIEPICDGAKDIESLFSFNMDASNIPILNSFYIQDLESARTLIDQTPSLDLYLNNRPEKQISIDSEEGQRSLRDMVKPEKTPSGRWPDPISQNQSLMQQFSINAAFDALQEKGIFSVNGPPGTGKTSLLREIVAENIVRRATQLAKLKTAAEAFVGKHAVSFDGFDSIQIRELQQDLVGFEMLVVSSNNTAVQNISKELPMCSQLGPDFQKASYLESVAKKAHENEDVWGLISASLGNKENCRGFVERVFIRPSEKNALRIWDFIDQYDGPTFQEAKEEFLKIKTRQYALFEELELLGFLHDETLNHTVESFAATELEALELFEQLEAKLLSLLAKETEERELLALLKAQEILIKPNPLKRMLSHEWRTKLTAIREEELKIMESLYSTLAELKATRESLALLPENEIIESLLNRALLFYQYQEKLQDLKQLHPQADLPNDIHELVQTGSYYQTPETSRIRSELFISAMTLHEAWLAETARPKAGFRGNLMAIAHMLQGKATSTLDDFRRIWQSLFMLVPVISSTFASVNRLFRYLEPASLGWVLIDEAGQASPQSAVGAIFRAKRVFTIGDPFQIEPICTIPKEVIDGMAKSRIQDNTLEWVPSQVSVQNLLDRISSFGSERTMRHESYWVSSPLRVHRRCHEPMFSISNAIAYENSMHLAIDNDPTPDLPPSCWWHVEGGASHRQYVAEQGESLTQLLKEIFMQIERPDIYIISPFREVVRELQKLLSLDEELQKLFEAKFPGVFFSTFVRESVGTVHAFQGKQAIAVFFVLGADDSKLGALDWASSKPNLLNVAVTRARSRLYIIGDHDLWKQWPYFRVAAKKLTRRDYSLTQS